MHGFFNMFPIIKSKKTKVPAFRKYYIFDLSVSPGVSESLLLIIGSMMGILSSMSAMFFGGDQNVVHLFPQL